MSSITDRGVPVAWRQLTAEPAKLVVSIAAVAAAVALVLLLRAETMRLLRTLAKERGTTVVIVSHDQRLREVADRVLWLESG